MANFAKGTLVRQIMPDPIVGTVQRYDVDQETGEVQVLVTWPDANGDGHEESHYFKVTEIKAVPVEEAPVEAVPAE